MNTKQVLKRSLFWGAMLALFCFAIYGSRIFAIHKGTYISPDGHYRLEYLRPGPPYLFSMTKQYPRFVRLYDNRTGRLLSESDIVDMNGGNGEIYWPTKEMPTIRVGMEIEFPVSLEAE